MKKSQSTSHKGGSTRSPASSSHTGARTSKPTERSSSQTSNPREKR